MLERLMELIASGSLQRPADLAERLGVSAELLEEMLAHLERAGYLERAEVGCGGARCAGCAAGCVAAGGRAGRVWRLAAAGQTD